MSEREICCDCDSPTGRAGRHDDSLYAGDFGPYCSDCWYSLPEKLASRVDGLTVALKGIRDHKPDLVTDKINHDVENCAECKRMESHPISRGRCNDWYHQHYRILGKQKDAEHREQYQMRSIARGVLLAANGGGE